jgi:hypothetical protein
MLASTLSRPSLHLDYTFATSLSRHNKEDPPD